MDQLLAQRQLAGARILRRYQDAGRGFDGIHQMLLSFLRDNRRSAPRPADDADLAGAIDGPSAPGPHFVIDEGVLLSYARLDNRTVGAALVEAVTDSACRVVVSRLACLRALEGGDDNGRRLARQLLLAEPPLDPGLELAVEVPALSPRELDLVSQLGKGQPVHIRHTTLLALRHRCVLGTLNPAAYHRLGYRRTLNLAE